MPAFGCIDAGRSGVNQLTFSDRYMAAMKAMGKALARMDEARMFAPTEVAYSKIAETADEVHRIVSLCCAVVDAEEKSK